MPYASNELQAGITVIDGVSKLLSFCASSARGLLSLSGILPIWPNSVIRAVGALNLTVAYEYEINAQNSKGALEKLSNPNYLKQLMVQQYLRAKFADYDHNRARFTLQRTLSADAKKKVRLTHEFVILKTDDNAYAVGYCDAEGEYCQKDISKEKSQFLDKYLADQRIANQDDIDSLNAILTEHTSEKATCATQNKYPVYAAQYIQQVIYLEQLKAQTHEEPLTQEEQKTINAIEANARKFEEFIFNALFSDDSKFKNLKRVVSAESLMGYKNSYRLDYKNGELVSAVMPCILEESIPTQFCSQCISPPEDVINQRLVKGFYTYHRHQILTEWIEKDREALLVQYKRELIYRYLAGFFCMCSGLAMALGNSYLLLEAFAVIPYLVLIPAGYLPFIIVPFAIFTGIAQFTLSYNSCLGILADNPFRKFWEKIQAPHWTNKTIFFLTAFALLLVLALFNTYCSIGTWVTIFAQSEPIFSWINAIPVSVLHYGLPIFLGVADLPFVFQSIANTLENLENNPVFVSAIKQFVGLFNGKTRLPNTWGHWKTVLYKLSLAPLGMTPEEFEKENWMQVFNLARMVCAWFKPVIILAFALHVFCEGAMDDQSQDIPIFISVGASILLAIVQDLDYFFGHDHIDITDTQAVAKKHFADDDNHDHHNNFPEWCLRGAFWPFFYGAACWSHYWRDPEKDRSTFDDHYNRIKGIQPRQTKSLAADDAHAFRSDSNHAHFLFKAAKSNSSVSLNSMLAQDGCGHTHVTI